MKLFLAIITQCWHKMRDKHVHVGDVTVIVWV